MLVLADTFWLDVAKARFFLLVDLQEIFFRSRVGGGGGGGGGGGWGGGRKKINKKALKMTS